MTARISKSLLSSEPPDARVCPVCGGEKNPHLRACEPCIQQPEMTARAHTPLKLPLTLHVHDNNGSAGPSCWVNDAEGHEVIRRRYHPGFEITVEELRAIVRACNTHAALLDALKAVVSQHDEWAKQMPEGEFDDPLSDAITAARAAIRAAEGEEGRE